MGHLEVQLSHCDHHAVHSVDVSFAILHSYELGIIGPDLFESVHLQHLTIIFHLQRF